MSSSSPPSAGALPFLSAAAPLPLPRPRPRPGPLPLPLPRPLPPGFAAGSDVEGPAPSTPAGADGTAGASGCSVADILASPSRARRVVRHPILSGLDFHTRGKWPQDSARRRRNQAGTSSRERLGFCRPPDVKPSRAQRSHFYHLSSTMSVKAYLLCYNIAQVRLARVRCVPSNRLLLSTWLSYPC